MRFTVKDLIILFVTSSALLLTPIRSDAQINIKLLAKMAKSCHKDVVSVSYYKKMGLAINTKTLDASFLQKCVKPRYYYSLVMSRFPWLSSTREIMPGYPGSVVVGQLAYNVQKAFSDKLYLLECLINHSECGRIHEVIASDYEILAETVGRYEYLIYVCPSCVVAYNDVSASRTAILKAFIQWFLKLDKPKRRELILLLGDEDKARELRQSIYNESETAVNKYESVRRQIEHEEQERRRQELIGN
ncbi:hypothetical protein BV372_00880 [Nostoc sp. T09]|uniref:hypothetical protein n=1 Tax=Nostoc sp. T09 TaxID=1932621 RepID=UPI000A3975C3|nr:hypothetical protein [Nostoc sp. T09]OUL37550.1 hypothetical protein BV372_00880 [Nostoc sp. T09]